MASFMLVTDLDGTLCGDTAATHRFNKLWKAICKTQQSKLVYNTGRSFDNFCKNVTDVRVPDVFIGGVGTELLTFQDGLLSQPVSNHEWEKHLRHGWDKERLVELVTQYTDESCVVDEEGSRTPFKYSIICTQLAVVRRLQANATAQFERKGLKVRIAVCSSAVHLGEELLHIDFLPVNAGKGEATKFIAQALGFGLSQTVVAGDSGNDITMFEVPEINGILVGNSKAELVEWCSAHPCQSRYHARQAYALGVLEGLAHYGFVHEHVC